MNSRKIYLIISVLFTGLTLSFGGTYYVSTSGDDGNTGAIDDPWLTWDYGVDQLSAGDTLYIREGRYYTAHDQTSGISMSGVDGGVGIWIMNYPGEVPILDASAYDQSSPGVLGITISLSNDIYIKGLTFEHWLMPSISNYSTAVYVYKSDNITVERCTMYDIGGWGVWVEDTCNNVLVKNNDIHFIFDDKSASPGAGADGITIRNGAVGDTCIVEGNRIWYFSDDGIDFIRDSAYVICRNNWVWSGGIGVGGAGNGFKMGGQLVSSGDTNRYIHNNISAWNDGVGYTPNGANGPRKVFYNNIAYHNGTQGFQDFTDTVPNTYKNNIAYDNTTEQSVKSTDSAYYNSWQTPPGVTITNGDFISIDTNDFYLPRGAGGALPDINFLHLESSSDLVDAGIDVGLPYNGIAPDLGAFEYEPSISGNILRSGPRAILYNGQFVRSTGSAAIYTYPFEPIVDYQFNQDTLDSSGNMNDFTPSSGYSSSLLSEDYNGWYGNMFASGSYVTTPVVDIGNKSVIEFDLILGSLNEPYRVAVENPDGYRIIVNPTDSSVRFVTYSSPTDSATLTTIAPAFAIDTSWEYAPIKVEIDIHRDEGVSRIYINGEDKTASGGSVKSDFETQGCITIGSDSLETAPLYAGIDNFRILSGNKSLTFIQDDYNDWQYNIGPVDIISPVLMSASVGANEPAVINAIFSESLSFVSEDSVIKALTYKQDTYPITIDSIQLDTFDYIPNNVLVIYAADTVVWDDTLTLSYTPVVSMGLEDLSSNQVLAFTDSSIYNNTCQAVRMAQYRFENNADDSYDNLDGTTYGQIYNSTYHVEGSLAAILTSQSTFIEYSYLDFGDNFSIAFWFHADSYSNDNRAVFANRGSSGTDGFAIVYNGVTHKMMLIAVNSSGTKDSAIIETTLTPDNWNHVVFTVDKSANKVFGYLDGSLDCEDSIVGVDFSSSGTFRLGNYTSNDKTVFSWIDDMQFYNGMLDAVGIDSIYSNIGEMFSGCASIPIPPCDTCHEIGDTTFTIYADSLYAYTFESTAADPQVTTADAFVMFPTANSFMQGTGDNDPGDYNISVVNVNAVSDGTGGATRAIRYEVSEGQYGITGMYLGLGGGGKIDVGYNRQSKLDVFMSYNVMHRPGQDFVIEEKHPALLHGDYNNWDDCTLTGVSFRYVAEGDNSPGQPEGGIRFYARWFGKYVPPCTWQSSGNGNWKNFDGTDFQFDVTDSTWYNITIRMGLNDLGVANGFLEGYVNGKLAKQWTGLELRGVTSNIDWLSIEWFYGGDLPVFAALYDEWAIFDDFYIWAYKTGYGPTPRQPAQAGTVLYNLPSWDVINGKKKETY